ncbi:MAG: LytTR family transcriptional regulator [Pseudomonadales bacterium]|nr:LytTR family transcriptional regulator [Pseudomonadales bacterium]
MSGFVARGPSSWSWSKPLRDKETFHGLAVNGLVVGCLTVLLTVSDAFETGHFGMAHQVALWLTVSLLLVAQLTGARYLLGKILPAGQLHSALTLSLSLTITILLMTVEMGWLKYTPLLPKQPDPFFKFLLFLMPPLSAISCLILLAQHLSRQIRTLQSLELNAAEQTKQSGKEVTQAIDVTDISSITQHLSVKHVQAEDHYLAVNSLEQKLMIRARMKDAIQCLNSVDGIQVHRSHWVAKDYIKRLYREGRDFKLVLQDESVVPVARSRMKELREVLTALTA